MNLQDKTVVLTGACGGIGMCIAQQLADTGARLILVGRERMALQRQRGMLPINAAAHLIHVANLSDADERDSLAQLCRETGVDILINNAGVGEFKLLEDSRREAIERLIDINLNVPIQLTRLLLPTLRASRTGVIVNIGSTFGSIAYPGYSVYSASKYGLRGFSEALRRELSDSAIRVLYFAPRATKTPLNDANVVALNDALGITMDAPEAVARALVKRIQNKRWHASVFGWPERFYAFLNGLNPSITDTAIRKQLPTIKRYATDESRKKINS